MSGHARRRGRFIQTRRSIHDALSRSQRWGYTPESVAVAVAASACPAVAECRCRFGDHHAKGGVITTVVATAASAVTTITVTARRHATIFSLQTQP